MPSIDESEKNPYQASVTRKSDSAARLKEKDDFIDENQSTTKQENWHNILKNKQNIPSSTVLAQAQSLMENKDYANAAKAFRDAYNENPSDRSLIVEEVKALWHAGKRRKARWVMKGLLRSDPCNHALQHNMGVLLLKSNRFARALPYLGNAFERCPNNPGYAYQFAMILFKLGKSKDALTIVEIAVQGKPDNLGYHTLKAEIALSEQACKPLEEAAQAVIRLAPEKAVGYAWMGQALAQQKGKLDKAVTYMGKAALIDFDNADYKRLLLDFKNTKQEES